MSTSNSIEVGHWILIEVFSSNFPIFNRNLNKGGNNNHEKAGVIAHNQIHHGPVYTSQIRLPIMKTESDKSEK